MTHNKNSLFLSDVVGVWVLVRSIWLTTGPVKDKIAREQEREKIR